jgi:hypothetical protein
LSENNILAIKKTAFLKKRADVANQFFGGTAQQLPREIASVERLSLAMTQKEEK